MRCRLLRAIRRTCFAACALFILHQAKGETIKTGREVWEQVPPFEYRPLTVQQSLASAWAPLLFLLFWLVAAGALVFALIPGAAQAVNNRHAVRAA